VTGGAVIVRDADSRRASSIVRSSAAPCHRVRLLADPAQHRNAAIRFRAQSETAGRVAEYLAKSPRVEKVYYPGCDACDPRASRAGNALPRRDRSFCVRTASEPCHGAVCNSSRERPASVASRAGGASGIDRRPDTRRRRICAAVDRARAREDLIADWRSAGSLGSSMASDSSIPSNDRAAARILPRAGLSFFTHLEYAPGGNEAS